MGRQVTEKKIARDQLRAVAHHAEQANSAVYLAPRDLLALLDQLGQLDKAEARIKAVEDALDRYAYTGIYTGQERVAVSDIRRALDGA